MFLVEIVDSGVSFICLTDQSLLGAMEKKAITDIPVGCRSGGCGICKVEVLSGEFTVGKMSRTHITLEDSIRKVGLACRIYPLGNMRIRVLRSMNRNSKTDCFN